MTSTDPYASPLTTDTPPRSRSVVPFSTLCLFVGALAMITSLILGSIYFWITPIADQYWGIDNAAVTFLMMAAMFILVAVIENRRNRRKVMI